MGRLKHCEGSPSLTSSFSAPSLDAPFHAARKPLPTSRWEAVGPFPAGMREHPLMTSPLAAFCGRFSPSGPLADPDIAFARAPYGEGDWPSELPTGGRAGWANFEEKEGVVEIMYPDVRWGQLRADHGWAALQYSAQLRTRITVPSGHGALTRLLVDATQVVEYAFVAASQHETPTWYNGDVYGFGGTPSGTASTEEGGPSNYARSIALPPGEYVFLARVLYECRMFGDPGKHPPAIKLGLHVYLDRTPLRPHATATLLPGLTVVPDILNGWAMGRWMSVTVRVAPLNSSASTGAQNGTVDVQGAAFGNGLTIGTRRSVRIVPGQTRSIPLLIAQLEPSDARDIEVILTFTQGEKEWQMETRVPLKHVLLRDSVPVTMTFPVSTDSPSLVSAAVVLPPACHNSSSEANSPPVLLALHGAGVPTPSDEWIDAMPRLPGMWAVLPSGRTEWGEDWHGGSMSDVWGARNALSSLLSLVGHTVSDETVLIGHSNGGQGVWHLAARYPDRVRGVIAVAGYTKIQDYVPYTESTGAHYADPALQGILSAALAPYNNDLYLSNLASIPVLAVHGADDDNVPPRHGRAQMAILSGFLGAASPTDVRFVEVPHVGHMWDGVLRHPAILDFLKCLPRRKTTEEVRAAGFILATANPDETGAKAGIRIAELAVPGRLARLEVNVRERHQYDPTHFQLHGTNVRSIDIAYHGSAVTQRFKWSKRTKTFVQLQQATALRPASTTRAYGPLMRLLDSHGPLTLVLGRECSERTRGIARAYAHDLRMYHRLDAALMDDDEALRAVADRSIGAGSIVILGEPTENRFAAWMLAQEHIPVSFPTRGLLMIEDRIVWESGTGGLLHRQAWLTPGIITLCPHPTYAAALACLVAGTDELGLELAARLLPLRTGVPVPDWAVVSPRMRWMAAGGLIGAGFWGPDWGWSESMSWMDRE